MNKDKNNTPKAKKGFFKSRSARRGAASIVITILFIAAVVLVNLIVAAITNSHPLYIDVTENSSFKLQSATTDYLDTVDKPVAIYILQSESDFENSDSTNYKYFVQANKLIRSIAGSSDKIDLHYIDLTADPTFTSDYNKVDWTKSHIALVVSGDQYRAIDLTDIFGYDQQQYQYYGTYVINSQKVEQAFLTAIMNVTSEEKTKVTVLSGQGEQDMTALRTLLENNAYEIEEVSLLNGEISADSEFAVIFAPEVDIDEKIYSTLTKWLDNNGEYGHHIIYFPNDQKDISEFPNLNTLLADYGMKLRYGYIYENSTDHLLPGGNHYVSVFDYSKDDTTFTEDLRSSSIPIVMSLVMPIEIADDSLAKPMLTSSDKAMFFPKDLSEDEAVDFDPKTEMMYGAAYGQRNAGTENGKSSSVVVIGSYDAVQPNYLSISSYNNAAYFVNVFNTLSDKDDVSVIIEGKDPSANDLGLTSVSEIQFPAILVRFVIPIGVLIAGLIIWIRRRHK